MTPIQVSPALAEADWAQRRYGTIAVDRAGGDPRLLVTDADGQLARVEGSDALFALMALANDALPDDDPRKLTRAVAEAVSESCDDLSAHAEIFLKLFHPMKDVIGADAGDREREALASFQRRCALLGQAGVTLRALVRPAAG